jgi:hypothetical protein
MQIQFKDAKARIEGQNVICLGEADVIADLPPPPGAGNSIVTRGTVSGGLPVMLWIAPTGKPDSLEGLCQGLVLGDRINPPASPVLATQGAYQPLQ